MSEPLQPLEAEGLGPAAMVIILLLGAALSVLLWQGLRRQQDQRVDREARFYAGAMAHEVEARLDDLVEALRRRTELWASAHIDPETADRAVEIFLAENPAAVAVLRGGRLTGSEAGKAAVRELLVLSARDETAPASDRVVGPVPIGGRPILGLQVRVSEPDRSRGAVFAAFDTEVLLADLLGTQAFGYAVRVEADGVELYRRPARERELQRLAHAEPIEPRFGKPWSLSVAPTLMVMPGSRVDSPAVVLVGGILASALLSAAVHFGTIAWRRAKALGVANQALRHQIEEVRRGAGELKQLSGALEARVAERTAELEETIVELETFNYSASHDLRGPLGAIINFAAILQEDYKTALDGTGREHVARIIRSAGTAVSMMNALLAYSRSRRAELQRVHLDMRRLVGEVCNELSTTYPGLPCSLKVGDLPPAFADESMMRLVFTNLISNACKFTPPGQTAQVEVGGAATADETTYYVRDDGIGFDMRFEDKLFKVFERLHAGQQYDGQGVGLAIVARMVRRHGGRVWAQSAVGKGATFHVALPARGIEDNATPAA